MKRIPEPELMDLADEARVYAQADFSSVNQAFIDRLLEIAPDRPAAQALDLGTGPADIPIRLVRMRPTWHVTAVDASPAMFDLARQAVRQAGLENSIDLRLVDAKATQLPDDRYDVILSNSILHHLADVPAFWRELRRVAAPGAAVLLRDLARPDTPQQAHQIVDTYAGSETPLLQEEYYRSLLAAYTVAEVRDQLHQAGLAGLKVIMITDRHLDVFGFLTKE